MTAPSPRDDERLTAYLDGEVDPAERAEVEALLAGDPEAATVLEELGAVRAALRALPDVEPPAGFLDGLIAGGGAEPSPAPSAGGGPIDELAVRRARREGREGRPRSRSRSLVGSVAAMVAMAAMALVFVPAAGATVPPVHDFMVRHEAMASGGPTPASTMPMEPMPMDQADAMGGIAGMPELDGMARAHVYTAGPTVHVVYEHDGKMVSVYRQRGAVAWNRLPAGGTTMRVGDDPAWELQDGGASAIVVERGAEVFTVVGAGSPDMVMGAAEALPDSDPTLADRVRRVLDVAARPFSL